MPAKLERKLKAQARKKGLKGKRFDKYVYGTLQKVINRKSKKSKK